MSGDRNSTAQSSNLLCSSAPCCIDQEGKTKKTNDSGGGKNVIGLSKSRHYYFQMNTRVNGVSLEIDNFDGVVVYDVAASWKTWRIIVAQIYD